MKWLETGPFRSEADIDRAQQFSTCVTFPNLHNASIDWRSGVNRQVFGIYAEIHLIGQHGAVFQLADTGRSIREVRRLQRVAGGLIIGREHGLAILPVPNQLPKIH